MGKFLEVRNAIQSIVSSSSIFVTPNTNWNIPGIYMIYIESPYQEKIIPFYIGQSKDIQKRYSKHLENILGLNRIHPDSYKKLFIENESSYYSGAFSICKVHKYMVDNRLPLSKFKMLILEPCDTQKLIDRESYYINKFYAPYFGFNQLNSLIYGNIFFSDLNPQPEMLDHLIDLLNQEMTLIPEHLNYGYTHFNLNYSFRTSIPESFGTKLMRRNSVIELNRALNDFNKQCKDIWQNLEYRRLMAEYEPYKKEYSRLQSKFIFNLRVLSEEINAFMEENRRIIPVSARNCFSNLALGGVINELPLNIQNKWKLQFQEEFTDYRQLQDIQGIIRPMRSRVIELKSSYLKGLYSEIIPNIAYPPFALKDSTAMFDGPKGEAIKKDEVMINMVISSNGRRFNNEQNPYLIRVEVFYYGDDGELKQKQWYVKNECTTKIKEGLIYLEEGYTKANPQIKPFSPYAFTKDEKEYISFISLHTEAKTGINDYTIQNNTLIPFEEILKEIELLIDPKTTTFIYTSEGPKPYERALLNENEGLKNNDLYQLLLRKKPRHQQIILKPKKKVNTTAATKENRKSKKVLTEEQVLETKLKRQEERFRKYSARVSELTDNGINVVSFTGSKEAANFQCSKCGIVWSQRSDHFLRRPYCRNCNMNKS